MLASTAGPVLAPDRWDAQETQRFLRAFCCPRQPESSAGVSGRAGEGGRVSRRRSRRPSRIEGWSQAPFAARLPRSCSWRSSGSAAVVRETAPFVFVGVLFAYLLGAGSARDRRPSPPCCPPRRSSSGASLPQPEADPPASTARISSRRRRSGGSSRRPSGCSRIGALVFDRRAIARRARVPARIPPRARCSPRPRLIVITPIALYAGTRFGEAELGGTFFGDVLAGPRAAARAAAGARVRGLERARRGARLSRRDAHVARAQPRRRRGEPRPGGRVRAGAHRRGLRRPPGRSSRRCSR